MTIRLRVWGLLLLAAPLPTRACDACGCSAAGPAALGLLPAMPRAFAGLFTQHQTFRTPLPDGSTALQAYTTVQVWGRVNLGRRFQLYGFLPYRVNTYQRAGVTTALSAPGDASLLAQVVVLRRDAAAGQPAQVLLAGAGVKAPTGRYRPDAEATRLGLPNTEPGTGAWDGQLAASYTLTGGRAGFNAEASYTLTTPNADDYKYGNRLGAGATAFLRLRRGAIDWLPLAGARYEHLLHDYDRYSRRWLNRSTGGSAAYAQAGVQAYRGRLGASLLGLLPVWQAPAGATQARARIEGGLTLFL